MGGVDEPVVLLWNCRAVEGAIGDRLAEASDEETPGVSMVSGLGRHFEDFPVNQFDAPMSEDASLDDLVVVLNRPTPRQNGRACWAQP